MRQEELEELVEQLADAERAAAEQIHEAEARRDERLKALRQELEQQHQQAWASMRHAFKQESKAQQEELEAAAQESERTTEQRIETLKQRHRQERDGLIRWLLESITPP